MGSQSKWSNKFLNDGRMIISAEVGDLALGEENFMEEGEQGRW